MNFNTVEFLFFFLPATLVVFYVVPVRLRLAVLFAASLIFSLPPIAIFVSLQRYFVQGLTAGAVKE